MTGMGMTTIDTLLTLDDYFDLPERPGVDFEMLDGEVVEMATPSFGHNEIVGECFYVLKGLCKTRFPKTRNPIRPHNFGSSIQSMPLR